MKKTPLVSVIIVNWNGGRVFRECLESLTKINYSNWELIIVDNGSSDGSQRLLQNFQFACPAGKQAISNFQLIQNKTNIGFAKANNQGYQKSKGKYILLLNNDTKVTPGFLTRLVARINADGKLGVIQPKIFLMSKPDCLDNAGSFLTRIGFLEHWGFGERDGLEFNNEREIFSAKGACMLIRREVIEKVGLFDPDFISYFEESDFCWRVWLGGWKVLFYPQAVVHHRLGYTIRRLDVSNLNYLYCRNRITSMIKNLELINLLVILPLHLVISLGIALIFLIKRMPKNSTTIFKAIGWNFMHLPGIYQKRKLVQRIRILSDKLLFAKLMHQVKWQNFYKDFRRIEEDIKRKTI